MEQQVTAISSNELNYSKKEFSHPKYKFQKIAPTAQPSNMVLSSGGDEVKFDLPTKVISLSNSVLEFKLTPAQSAAFSHNVAYCNPLSAIRSIQLRTTGGQLICDLNFCNKYMDLVYLPETKLDDFLSNPLSDVAGLNKHIGIHRSNKLVNGAPAGGSNVNLITCANDGTTFAEEDPTMNYTERLYYTTSTADQALDPVLNISFPMKYLYNTIFSVNKNLYFGEIIELRIIFDEKKASMYSVKGTGAPINTTTLGTIVNASGYEDPPNLTLSDAYLYLAVEQDITTANGLIQLFNGGIDIPIPYVYGTKTSITQSTQQSMTLRYNSGNGKKIRKIYHTICHPNEYHQSNYLRDNINGGKTVVDYYTSLNNDRLQDFNITCSKYDDYRLMGPKLKKSAVQSVSEYQYKWFHVDDFTGEGPLCEDESKDINRSSGIPLNIEQKWEFTAQTANRALTHYTFVVTEKTLSIKPGAIQIY